MILVVSPNLALDRTLHVKRLRPGSVHRSESVDVQPGGKGVNVMRALASLESLHSPGNSLDARLIGFQGGASGTEIASGLQEEGLPFLPVSMAPANRVCTIVVDSVERGTNRASVINETGPLCTSSDATELRRAVESNLDDARVVAFMGSLPPGIPTDLYQGLIRKCHTRRIATLLDTSGEALRLGIEASPNMVCPNLEEAETIAGRRLESIDARRAILNGMLDQGVELAILTLGSEGALAQCQHWCARATASVERGYGRFPQAAARIESTWFERLDEG